MPDDSRIPAPASTGVKPSVDPAASSPAESLAYRRRWWILAVALCAAIMDLLDSTIITVAAPSIRAELGGGPGVAQWLAAGYTLPFAVLLILGGRLGDIVGRRRMFLIGAVGFVAASLACAVAPTPEVLIGARVVQGAAGALLIPQSFGILRSVFPAHELGRAFGAFAPAMGLSAMGGPLLAGLLIDADLLGTGWRMIFLINLPLGLAAIAGAWVWMPRAQDLLSERLDLVGAALLTIASVLVIYPLIQGQESGWPGWSIAMAAVGVLGFAVFAIYERHSRRPPVIAPSLLGNRTFVGGLTVALVFFGVVAGLQLVLSLFLQSVLRFSALHTGLTFLPMPLGIALAAPVSGLLVPRFGRVVLQAGLGLVAVGLAGLAATVHVLDLATTTWTLAPSMLVTGIGMGMVFGPLYGVILNGVDDHEVGSTSGTLTAAQQFGGAVGVAGVTTAYYALNSGHAPTSAFAVTALLAAAATAATVVLALLLPRQVRDEHR